MQQGHLTTRLGGTQLLDSLDLRLALRAEPLRTGRVDARFGQAECADGGAGLLIEVRCDVQNELQRGSQALIVSFDDEREAYVIEPV